MLLLREALTVSSHSQRDWMDAAHSVMLLVQSCVRNNLLHHACGCYNESSLANHMLFLPSQHTSSHMPFLPPTPPKDLTLLKLMHRCVVGEQCTGVTQVDSASVSHHRNMGYHPLVTMLMSCLPCFTASMHRHCIITLHL
jgi:hypothetical protein